MLHTISNQELEHLLTLDHPTWTPQAIAQQAEEYRNFLDDRLDAPPPALPGHWQASAVPVR